jgi:hypothetical protein
MFSSLLSLFSEVVKDTCGTNRTSSLSPHEYLIHMEALEQGDVASLKLPFYINWLSFSGPFGA